MGRKKVENRPVRILDAADKLFRQLGVEQTTIGLIAQEAGISKAAVYLDFSDKDDILLGVITRFIETEYQGMLDWLATHQDDTTLQQLSGLLKHHFSRVLAYAMSHYKPIPTYRFQQSGLYKPTYNLEDKPIQLVETLLQKAVKEGQCPSLPDCGNKAQLLFMTLVRTASPPFPPHLTETVTEQFVHDLVDVLIQGLTLVKLGGIIS